MFVDKKVSLVVLESRGGLSKSYSVDEVIKGKDVKVLSSHLTPLSNYMNLYKFKDKSIVLRDLDALLTNNINVSLLKQCAETKGKTPKTISYHSSTPRMDDVPASFTTTSNILIETNSFQAKTPALKALESRGFHILFEPSKTAIIEKMREITEKPHGETTLEQRKQVLNFIEARKGLVPHLNLRHLVNGFGLYSYGIVKPDFDWKTELSKFLELDQRLSIIQNLSETNLKVEEQIKIFSQKTSLSRSQFFNLKKKIQ